MKIQENLDLVLNIFTHTFQSFHVINEITKGEFLAHYMKIKTAFGEFLVKVLSGQILCIEKPQNVALLNVLHCFFSVFDYPALAEKLTVDFTFKFNRKLK